VLQFRCCRGALCNAPPPSAGACFVADGAVRVGGTNSTPAGGAPEPAALPARRAAEVPAVQNTAVGCEAVPGAAAGTCVVVTQHVLGRNVTTGMCYSDALRAAFSARDWCPRVPRLRPRRRRRFRTNAPRRGG
jgi:hypothetical protein